MAKSNSKRIKQKIKKIIFIMIISIAFIMSFSIAFATYKAVGDISQKTYLSNMEVINTPETTPTATKTSSKTPAPTQRVAFIPDPDELQPLPNLANINFTKNALTGNLNDTDLSVYWEIVEEADYYVFYAINDEGKVYHKDILWPDISEWLLPQAVTGNIYLFSYKDMGEDSAKDDRLIDIYSMSVKIEEEKPIETKKPTAAKEADEVMNKYLIIVDKSDFTFGILTYDEFGEYNILVDAFPTAIGLSSRMTPNGTFAISSKGAWKSWSTGSYSPYYTRFTSGLYFHGAVYSDKRNNTMYKSYYNDIGTAASSGCLRTTFEAAKWVYYNCPAGTVVKIVDSSNLVARVTKIPLDPAYPRWDPTDPDKPHLSPPAVITNTLLKLDEGSFSPLKDYLLAVDEKMESDDLIFEIVTPPKNGTLNKTNFTQAEINDGTIIYTHDSSETETDSFQFTVTNLSSQTGVITFSIKIDLIDDTAPVIEKNEWITVEQGSSCSLEGLLLSIDNEVESNELIYTITTPPSYGTIPESFTQAELLSSEVIYLHDGSNFATDSFVFSVSDGTNILTGQMFSININILDIEPTEEP